MIVARRIPAAAGCLVLLAAINVYLCRNLFVAEYTGHANSIQGLWISMARLAGEHWFRPSWWPYQDAGVPFEHTYMPLVPASSALLAKIAGVSAARGFFSVMGVVLCLGPVTLFLLIWRLSGAPRRAFVASLVYSLTSPARALLPEPDVNPIRYWSSMRFYGVAVWDDLPHQTAMCLLPLALLFLWRAMEKRRPVYYVLAVLFMALTVLASVFGATALMLGVICMLAAFPGDRLRANLRLVLVLGVIAYLLVLPFLPPSVLATIRENQQKFVEDRWSADSFLSLGLVMAGALLLSNAMARWSAEPWVRFFVLFAFLGASIPLMDAHLHSHFLPQPNRYTAEMEFGVALLLVPLIAWVWKALPRGAENAVAALLIYGFVGHVPVVFRFADESTRPVDMTRGIEYRVARWVDENMPGQRVMVPGSIAHWFNVFSAAPQLSGASYATTPNWVQHEAMKSALTSASPAETEVAVLWLKAFGVQAATAVGRKSKEFWKGPSSTKFDALMPVLWRQDDTTIYRVPQRSASLAHVIPAAAVADSPSIDALRRYVAALDDPAMPLAEMRWNSLRSASIDASLRSGHAVSVQTGYHRGWHARANGESVEIRRDGLGFLLIQPRCDGPCRIELTYDGGWEYKLCRGLSLLAMIGGAIYAIRHGVRYTRMRYG